MPEKGPEGDSGSQEEYRVWWLIQGGSNSKCKGPEAALVLAPWSPGGSEGQEAGLAAPASESCAWIHDLLLWSGNS